jgi:hypothetical protein
VKAIEMLRSEKLSIRAIQEYHEEISNPSSSR